MLAERLFITSLIHSYYLYEIELWFNNININREFHNVSVGYHKAVKRIAGLRTWDSNHLACASAGVNMFRHLQAN